jgi:hypothetical protein
VKTLNDATSYAAAITAAWHKSVEAALEVAKLCAEANKELSPADKAEMLQQLPFKAPTFSKLVKIGNDWRLHAADMLPRLPSSFSSMYEIALCSDPQLEKAIESGVLHPGATREEIEAVRKTAVHPRRATLREFDGEPADETRPLSKVERICFAELHVPEDFPPEQGERLAADLTRLAESYGIELVRRLTPEEQAEVRYGNALNAFARRWEGLGRKLARRRINELKRQARQNNKKWGFKPDEVEINATDGWDRIEEVMAFVGLEAEMDELRAKAESLAEAPGMPAELGEQSDPVELWLPKKKFELNDFSDWI